MRTHPVLNSSPAPLRPKRILCGLAAQLSLVLVLLPSPCLAQDEMLLEDGREVVDMGLDEPANFTLRNVVAPLTSLFVGGPGYWYDERKLVVETTPAGGVVDLFYVRANFQKRFEQAETPAVVILPPRIAVGPRDALIIRAFAEGYQQSELTIPVATREERIQIDLEALPNGLVAFRHRGFAQRASLALLTRERLEPRVQRSEDGFDVILTQTSLTAEARRAFDGVSGQVVAEAYPQQLGEDLMLRVVLGEQGANGKSEIRSTERYDVARDLYVFQIDVVPSDGGRAAVAQALTALAAIERADVSGCALHFDKTLRSEIGVAELARALVPSGDFTDRYLRAAMRRLGELMPDEIVHFSDGTEFRPTVPIELDASLSQANAAIGYLALLRSFVAELQAEPHRVEALRSLIAPELDAPSFAEVFSEAGERELACLASG